MEASEHARRSGSRPASRRRTPTAFRICDGVTEGLLYFQAVFAPWAFGTTERWSIWTMNAAGYGLGGLLLAKGWIRWRSGYRPMRWGEAEEVSSAENQAGGMDSGPEGEGAVKQSPRLRRYHVRARAGSGSRLLAAALATLTVAILGYCLVSAVNARSTFIPEQMAFVPHDYVAWLPHSYDSSASWQAFWTYLGLALTYWAARDWLLGKTAGERRDMRGEGREARGDASARPPGAGPVDFPARLQRLLWLLCLNGALLSLEGILQRLSGTDKLLWLVQPYWNQAGDLQFGPYAYRSNAAEYLNLLWPVCLGFWWTLRRAHRRAARAMGGAGRRVGSGPHVVLLPCAVLSAAAPIISASRGGAIVAVAGMLVALVLLLKAQRRGGGWMLLGVMVLFAAALLLAGRFGWEKLEPRLKTIFSDEMSGRVEIYRNAEQMARDFPVFGTGPGTFAQVYHLYRAEARATWAAYAHNDWLETRITFGWVGFVMILASLGIVLARSFGGGGIGVDRFFVFMTWLALAGCLVHARFDFPFQIYSTLGLFVEICAVLFCVSRGDSSGVDGVKV
jgi:O-antigen ligase